MVRQDTAECMCHGYCVTLCFVFFVTGGVSVDAVMCVTETLVHGVVHVARMEQAFRLHILRRTSWMKVELEMILGS